MRSEPDLSVGNVRGFLGKFGALNPSQPPPSGVLLDLSVGCEWLQV